MADQKLFDHPCKHTCSGWAQGYERGMAAGMEAAAKLCDAERVRQINADQFGRLNGQDTAFALAKTIREWSGEES